MMTNEEAKMFLDNLKICIDEHPIVADWLVEIANRKTEPTISKMEQVEDETRLTAKCLNCANGGSYKCSKCDGEMYYKYDKDEPQTERRE